MQNQKKRPKNDQNYIPHEKWSSFGKVMRAGSF